MKYNVKGRDQIDTIERLGIKLKYNVKDRDQICNLPFFFFQKNKNSKGSQVSRLSTKNRNKNLNCGLDLLTEHGSEIRPTNWTELLLSSPRSSFLFYF